MHEPSCPPIQVRISRLWLYEEEDKKSVRWESGLDTGQYWNLAVPSDIAERFCFWSPVTITQAANIIGAAEV